MTPTRRHPDQQPRPIRFRVIDSPIGPLTLAGTDRALTHICMQDQAHPPADQADWIEDPAGFGDVIAQLEAYFAGELTEFDIELDAEKPSFWAFSDLAGQAGKTLLVEVDELQPGGRGLEALVQSDQLPDAEGMYRERLRPQFHFTSRRGWHNDPNGMVWQDGKYHLFYQHNPFGWNWGNMHWGHAVSPDLVHWKELPTALYPRKYGDWAFSGSAIVDAANTGGFQKGGTPPLVAAYTSTGRGECIVFSNDGGLTWSEIPENPVVKHAGRDPRLPL